MSDAAPKHETMPYGMMVGEFLPGIEYHTQGITQSAGNQQPHHICRHSMYHRFDDENRHPSESKVAQGGDEVIFAGKEKF